MGLVRGLGEKGWEECGAQEGRRRSGFVAAAPTPFFKKSRARFKTSAAPKPFLEQERALRSFDALPASSSTWAVRYSAILVGAARRAGGGGGALVVRRKRGGANNGAYGARPP